MNVRLYKRKVPPFSEWKNTGENKEEGPKADALGWENRLKLAL